MDMIKKSLAYTQTFRSDVLNNGASPQFQFNQVAGDLCMLLRRYADFRLYPELTVNNVIHFHGILDFVTENDEHMFRKHTVKKLKQRYGFLTLRSFDAYRTKDIWIKYITKDLAFMPDMVDSELPLTETRFKLQKIRLTGKMQIIDTEAPRIQHPFDFLLE